MLNWQNAAATKACIESILAQRSDVRYEIVVVDNESTRGSRAALGHGPWRMVCLSRNEGFTGGMNAGAGVAEGEFIALLNNDTQLPPDWLTRALSHMDGSRVGVVGGRDEGQTLPHIHPDGFSSLSARSHPPGPVPAVDGGHMLVRRQTWRQLGGLDVDFFAYYDDIDLCARAIAQGWLVMYDPELRVGHVRGASSDRVRWRRSFWARRNRTIWVAKHFPAGLWRSLVLAAALEYAAESIRSSRSTDGPLRDEFSSRGAALAAFAWVLVRGRWLGRKRGANVAAGQHSSEYHELISEHHRSSQPG